MTESLNPLVVQIGIMEQWRLLEFGFVWFAISVFVWRERKLSFWPKLLWWYAATMCYLPLAFPFPLYDIWSRAYESSGGQSLIAVLFIPWLVLNTKISTRIYACICFWIEIIMLMTFGYGLLNHSSLDLALIALCLPCFESLFPIATGVVFIFCSHASTAQLMLAAYFLVFIARSYQNGWAFAISLCLGAIPLVYKMPHFLDGFQSRWDAWGRYLPAWYGNTMSIVTGVGGGSFMWSSLIIDNFKAPYFLAMHSDWLQILFEYGLIGCILALILFAKVLRSSWRNYNAATVYGVVGLGVFGLTYHPLRFIVSGIFIALIFRDAISIKKNPLKPFDSSGPF